MNKNLMEEKKDPYISPHEKYCIGSMNADTYFLGFNVSAAKVPLRFTHQGSDKLDRICAFDVAEVSEMYMGQINLIEVSSFCGPHGRIWGYDVAKAVSDSETFVELVDKQGKKIPVRDGDCLIDAAKSLFGTIDTKKFPLAPGSHCFTTYESRTEKGPGTVYAAFAIGIPEDAARSNSAALLMEDVGFYPGKVGGDFSVRRRDIIEAIGKSIIAISEVQNVPIKEIFTGVRHIDIETGEMGCALVAGPYFSLARNAMPDGGLEELERMSLNEWSQAMKD